MKYAIGEITFLGVRFGMSCVRARLSLERQQKAQQVSHDVGNW